MTVIKDSIARQHGSEWGIDPGYARDAGGAAEYARMDTRMGGEL